MAREPSDLLVAYPATQVLEQEKRRNLSKQQHKTSTPIDEAPGWNENLASASEAAVKVRLYGILPENQEAHRMYAHCRLTAGVEGPRRIYKTKRSNT